MIGKKFAEDFAKEWERAWNAHDLEEILSHYSEDFQMTSPFIPATMDEATGTLKGKAKVGEYWRIALDRFPELRFETQMVLVGQNSIVIRYRSFRNELNLEAAEVMIFGDDGKVVESFAHYDEVSITFQGGQKRYGTLCEIERCGSAHGPRERGYRPNHPGRPS